MHHRTLLKRIAGNDQTRRRRSREEQVPVGDVEVAGQRRPRVAQCRRVTRELNVALEGELFIDANLAALQDLVQIVTGY